MNPSLGQGLTLLTASLILNYCLDEMVDVVSNPHCYYGDNSSVNIISKSTDAQGWFKLRGRVSQSHP